MRFRSPRRAGALAVAISLAAPLVVTGAGADPLADTWVRRAPTASPPARNLPAMAYDAARRETVLFGGYGPAGNNPQRTDTWVWKDGAWTQRTPSTHPGFCPAPEMAYDAAHSETVLFCGYGKGTVGETWTWSGEDWTRHTVATSPSARQHYILVYDAARGETVLFGGMKNTGSRANDTWGWTGSAWVQRTPATSPPIRDGAAATYDSRHGEIVLFGGVGTAGPLTDTWTYDGSSWTERHPLTSPPHRWTATMAYDVPRGSAVLFGGADVQTGAYRDDTWAWGGGDWTQVQTATSPPARYSAGMVFDEADSQTVLYGGEVGLAAAGNVEADDTWTLDSLSVDCGDGLPAGSGLPPGSDSGPLSPPADDCCGDPPTDAAGNVLVPPGATDVEIGDVETIDNGSTESAYPGLPTSLDTWYDDVDCPWSIGGEVPPLDDYLDVDTQLRDAGFSSPSADLVAAFDKQSEDVLVDVQRPTPVEMVNLGPITARCPSTTKARATAEGATAEIVTDKSASVLQPVPARCTDRRSLNADAPFRGKDVIYVHGFDKDSIVDRLNGVPAAETTWPADAAEFTSPTGYWKQRADGYWRDHITRYLKGGNPASTPSNRYLVVAWPSTRWLGQGIHAFLSQVASAMATGAGVVSDSSGSTAGFCARGCLVESHSTGGPLVDAALAIASGTSTWPLSTMGNLTWIPERISAHVAYSGAFGGSHYATVAAALGWAAAFSAPLCDLVQWVMSNVFGMALPCSRLTVIAESVLTDLAVPIMQTLWRPIVAATQVPVLLVTGGHPTAVGIDGFAKTVSPIVKMLFHHGFDDGVLSLDSQCATFGGWRAAPQSFSVRPTVPDAIANGALLANGLPAVVAARAYDMGDPVARAVPLYVDQVVGAQIATPQFWKAVADGTLMTHFASAAYRASAGCVPYLSPTGMVEQVASRSHPGSATQWRLPNHYSFLMSASDHYTGPIGAYDTLCYEVTYGSGRDCSVATANTEEVRAIDDPAVYTRGLVNIGIANKVVETVKGKPIRFKLFKRRYTWWVWKRTYHRLAGWQLTISPDWVYAFVLR